MVIWFSVSLLKSFEQFAYFKYVDTVQYACLFSWAVYHHHSFSYPYILRQMESYGLTGLLYHTIKPSAPGSFAPVTVSSFFVHRKQLEQLH